MIQFLVPVPVCCMFYISQKPNIKQSPNGIKQTENYFGIFVIFGRKNQHETVPEVATRVAHATTPGGCAPHSRGPPVRQLMPFFCRKKANFMGKISAKDSPQSELQIFGYKRNGERVESANAENAETER